MLILSQIIGYLSSIGSGELHKDDPMVLGVDDLVGTMAME